MFCEKFEYLSWKLPSNVVYSVVRRCPCVTAPCYVITTSINKECEQQWLQTGTPAVVHQTFI